MMSSDRGSVPDPKTQRAYIRFLS